MQKQCRYVKLSIRSNEVLKDDRFLKSVIDVGSFFPSISVKTKALVLQLLKYLYNFKG